MRHAVFADMKLETGSTLFALEVTVEGQHPRVLLNPGHFVIPPLLQNCVLAFVIAPTKLAADLTFDCISQAALKRHGCSVRSLRAHVRWVLRGYSQLTSGAMCSSVVAIGVWIQHLRCNRQRFACATACVSCGSASARLHRHTLLPLWPLLHQSDPDEALQQHCRALQAIKVVRTRTPGPHPKTTRKRTLCQRSSTSRSQRWRRSARNTAHPLSRILRSKTRSCPPLGFPAFRKRIPCRRHIAATHTHCEPGPFSWAEAPQVSPSTWCNQNRQNPPRLCRFVHGSWARKERNGTLGHCTSAATLRHRVPVQNKCVRWCYVVLHVWYTLHLYLQGGASRLWFNRQESAAKIISIEDEGEYVRDPDQYVTVLFAQNMTGL